jgi:hypothetical protein
VQAVTSLLRGHRVGVAFRELYRFFEQTNTELTTLTESNVADAARRAHLWMLRQDLAGFVLLGDPAARLPVPTDIPRPAAPTAVDPGSFFSGMQVTTAARPPAAAPDLATLERAIAHVLLDEGALPAIANRFKLDARVLADAVDRYRRAGRDALSKT